MQTYDHILIIGFGAPEALVDVKPFLKTVAKGRNIPEERLNEVYHHYELMGGGSPYNKEVFQVANALETSTSLPVFVGFRNWNPFLKETLSEIKEKGFQKGLALIFSPFRSIHSCKQYKDNLEEAKKEAGFDGDYTIESRWFDNPLFIEAQIEVIQEGIKKSEFQNPTFIFSAHSIPEESLTKCSHCNYKEEFEMASRLVAEKLNLKKWQIAFQSRSGNPRQPWLGPDINEAIQDLAGKGEGEAIIIPIGFFCNNVEILYDIDIELKKIAESKRIRLFRVSTISHERSFVSLLTEHAKISPPVLG